MIISRKSPISGITTTRDINVTFEQLEAWAKGALIQNAMPQLDADDREFIKTGITPKEWDALAVSDKEAVDEVSEDDAYDGDDDTEYFLSRDDDYDDEECEYDDTRAYDDLETDRSINEDGTRD